MQKRILVVEDDIELVDLLSFNLKGAGFSVGTALEGVQAIKKARSLLPDLILLDLMLPELDGFAVCEILRRDSSTAAIPVIMLTPMTSQFARLTGLDCGARDFITKPFSTKHLLTRVEDILSSPTDPTPVARYHSA